MNELHNANKVGKTFKILLNRIKKEAFSSDCEGGSCDGYGCLECKYFQRREDYDYQWGMFKFCWFKCKKRPDRNMMFNENLYYDKTKCECPYFERGENELIYMTDREKKRFY